MKISVYIAIGLQSMTSPSDYGRTKYFPKIWGGGWVIFAMCFCNLQSVNLIPPKNTNNNHVKNQRRPSRCKISRSTWIHTFFSISLLVFEKFMWVTCPWGPIAPRGRRAPGTRRGGPRTGLPQPPWAAFARSRRCRRRRWDQRHQRAKAEPFQRHRAELRPTRLVSPPDRVRPRTGACYSRSPVKDFAFIMFSNGCKSYLNDKNFLALCGSPCAIARCRMIMEGRSSALNKTEISHMSCSWSPSRRFSHTKYLSNFIIS